MATSTLPDLLANDKVLFQCTCGVESQLFRMFFCSHCNKTRCKYCVSHEVNSQYCEHCLEYIPTNDAKLKKNKCSTCYQCPSCAHILSTKVNVIQLPNEQEPEKMIPKKMYYLACLSCGWSSRDIGMPDQTSLIGGWPEITIPHDGRIESLYDHYRALAQKEKFEKLEKEIRKYQPGAGRAIHLLDKYGISASLSPKVTAILRAKIYGGKMSPGILSSPTTGESSALMGGNIISPLSPDKGAPSSTSSGSSVEPAVARPVDEPLDLTKYYGLQSSSDEVQPETEPKKASDDPNSVTSLNQRLYQIEIQPETREDFKPVSKSLLVKRAYRCKECDRNLCKPEYNPSSIKFKILLCAYYNVPELKIKTLPKLVAGQEAKIELTMSNPLMFPMTIVLHSEGGMGSSGFALDGTKLNHDVRLHDGELKISARDPTAELDVDHNLADQYSDDQDVISFRKPAKIGLWIRVIPDLNTPENAECVIAFRLAHDLQQVSVQVTSSGSSEGTTTKESRTTWLTHRVQLKLGPVSKN